MAGVLYVDDDEQALVLHPDDTSKPMVADDNEECCCEDTPCCCTTFDPFGSPPLTVTATIVGCGALSSGTITLNQGAESPCPNYTGSDDVGNCGSTVNLGMTLMCDGFPCGFTLEVRRSTNNCTVNGGVSQTLPVRVCNCDPLSLTFGPFGPVDDSGIAPGSCDCCPGGSFDVIITA